MDLADAAAGRPGRRAEPRADARGVRALTRFAEQPAEPARLGPAPADGGAPAGGDPSVGTWPAPGERGAGAAGLAEPDLERLLTRVLDDAARRHGIEV
ncbi:hypothetical protein [Pengzhenrongella sicca]|uniref:Uncharacterized protein n=1 Tax=Pengzhenrongella sicca TaxID=2819238 RepID=A0A8A4ZGN8_9MICO|nr:hypothetical protein [Pengzhenrongella sicca]QTE31202.1 hypothetical protein J4E96_09945 [Pengzhenrongella sicca]